MDEKRPEQTRIEGQSVGVNNAHDGKGPVYRIRIKGHLDRRWSAWFDGLVILAEQDGTTTLTGPITDQPALHGVLVRIRDLGLCLLSVNQESDKILCE